MTHTTLPFAAIRTDWGAFRYAAPVAESRERTQHSFVSSIDVPVSHGGIHG
jgi:hypothetical protein